MKTLLKQSLLLTAALLLVFAVIYPLLIAGIGLAGPGKGGGIKLEKNGKVIGYENIGQKFSSDRYFNGRPSAVDYNAAGSGGSNKATGNPAYLRTVQERIDTFLVHNPTVKKSDIPADLVTASGSGLDPHISVNAAMIQVDRISHVRHVSPAKIQKLINQHTAFPYLGIFGTTTVHVLKLNLALDELK